MGSDSARHAACIAWAEMRNTYAACLLVTSLLRADSAAPLIAAVNILGTTLHVDLATQVGRPYDTAVIEKDVRHLWSTGRFSDIRVERTEKPDGAGVIFRVTEAQTRPLHKIQIDPSTFGLQLSLPEGTPIDEARAHAIAGQARDELQARGFRDPVVESKLVPFVGKQVDLRLMVDAGGRVRARAIEFVGDPGLDPQELRGALHALRVKRVTPPIPGLWGGWRMFPAYSSEALQSDLARLQSLYLARGYLDASVRVDDVAIRKNEASISIRVEAGSRYRVRSAAIGDDPVDATSPGDLCPSLLAAQREAEQQGILDFSVTLDARQTADSAVDLETMVDRGRPYRVRRIDFIGNHRYRDAMLRSTLLLEEGRLLDERLLRKSVARLNQTTLFEPIDERSVHVRTDEAAGLADVTIQLRERKGGAWNLSGPVGPASFAGPLEASLRSRLPSWGAGLLELSTYTATISLYAFAPPLVPALSVLPKHAYFPVLALQRPFLPGEGWRSGFYIAPQLGLRGLGLIYATTQLQQRLLPLLAGDRGLVPELPVTVVAPHGEGRMFCEPPGPRLMPLRTGVSLAVRFLGVLTGL